MDKMTNVELSDFITEPILYQKQEPMGSNGSKRKLTTVDRRRVKVYKHLAEAVSEGDWKQAERHLARIKKDKYSHGLPGVSASEMTRIQSFLEKVVDEQYQTYVNFWLGTNGQVYYNI